jgi:hypothetical protein
MASTFLVAHRGRLRKSHRRGEAPTFPRNEPGRPALDYPFTRRIVIEWRNSGRRMGVDRDLRDLAGRQLVRALHLERHGPWFDLEVVRQHRRNQGGRADLRNAGVI